MRMTFTATSFSVERSRALYTTPVEPSPDLPRSSKRSEMCWQPGFAKGLECLSSCDTRLQSMVGLSANLFLRRSNKDSFKPPPCELSGRVGDDSGEGSAEQLDDTNPVVSEAVSAFSLTYMVLLPASNSMELLSCQDRLAASCAPAFATAQLMECKPCSTLRRISKVELSLSCGVCASGMVMGFTSRGFPKRERWASASRRCSHGKAGRD
mmetsp:Transcript_92775/g.198929  ORF Transcript_92775/g.198929 Transcript_92775/m.198929 type:complete len:210 (+) Transcript_92775:746-1375(+)